ncbi:pentapeptide MXKDX repeat protein [uncultured Agrobacterium sp.]|uniref:pentapeptide MXKDX repeat protein n=1 Tax=uncultured Agrobacterium sp. TaxID=157277 RepID=UPI0025D56EAC|nr:pentapeptide MXKDX repeat protein [uncultured Agrobacterium sp.]
MTRTLIAIAATSMLSALSFAGSVHADGMKTGGMTKDAMQSGTMKMETMKKDGMPMTSKKDCMHKAGMDINKMKKADMMKACDTMK